MITCEIDGKEFKNGGVLARYLKSAYSLTYREYYHKYILKSDEIPKCKCGCGKEMSWGNIGYREFVKGHYSRVHNNWGHNTKAIEKSAETRRQQFANGERKVWNVGLTKETDKRVKINGELSSKGILSNKEEIKRRSKSMSINRLNGIIPTLYGENHSGWKGGYSRIKDMIYADTQLYKQWKYPILVRDGFKCVECESVERLHIHHNKEKMCEIVHRYLSETTEEMLEDFKIKKMIVNSIVDYHIKNKVSGITLCGDCHNKYHPSLNFS